MIEAYKNEIPLIKLIIANTDTFYRLVHVEEIVLTRLRLGNTYLAHVILLRGETLLFAEHANVPLLSRTGILSLKMKMFLTLPAENIVYFYPIYCIILNTDYYKYIHFYEAYELVSIVMVIIFVFILIDNDTIDCF